MRRAVGLAAAIAVGLLPATPVQAAPSQLPGYADVLGLAEVKCADPGPTYKPQPWTQQALDAERTARFARGSGITVAVLDTGVDAGHPQLAGRVAAGFDAVANRPGASSDCSGHGTAVAGIIAAQAAAGTGVVGLAPGVTILPVRVYDDRQLGTPVIRAATIARGINWAVGHGADVIDVAVATYEASDALRAAVAGALSHDVTVVAAVGDRGEDDEGNPTPYPAAYDGVLGVGAVTADAAAWPASQHGTYVDLAAPGADVVSLARGHGHLVEANGTGFASAYAAATAALVRSARSGLSASAVNQLIAATATPAGTRATTGFGIVNPYAATTEERAAASPAPLPALAVPAPAEPGPWAHARAVAFWGGAIALTVAFLAVVLGITLPRGRRRRWRAALAAPPRDRSDDLEPSGPVLLFEEHR
jgi:membrane-anchored mycosin MYCP